jgi:hypothetical protein
MPAKKIALGFGIAIVLPMLIHYGVATFYPEPRPEDYPSVGRDQCVSARIGV